MFKDYFDKFYIINLKERTDRLESITNLLSVLDIINYKIITPIPADNIKEYLKFNTKLTPSSMSCKLAHMSCIEDAINNNYNKIFIFEDDAVFNQEDSSILENIEFHLNECISFLNNNAWDVFYFDNIKYIHKDSNNVVIKIDRFKDLLKIKQTYHKTFAHSYAINKSIFIQLLLEHRRYDRRNDNTLKLLAAKKYFYVPGIFDQKLLYSTDNVWNYSEITTKN